MPSHAYTALNRNGWNRYEVTCVKDLIRIEVSGIETARVRDMVFIAHADWMHTGDAAWLAHRYESLKTKTLLHRAGNDGLVRSDEQDRSRHDLVDWPPQERDGFAFTEINTVVNAFHIEAMKRMAVMARGLGKDDEAAAFDNRVRLASEAFQATLFNDATGLYRDGVGTDHSSVHANLFPLAFGLVPKPQQPAVIAWLDDQGMRCSVYAAQYLLEGLLAHGGSEQALALIQADGDRSWRHMLESGTTITWEAWEMRYKPNQDWNHAWGAAPANLLPRFVLGAQPAEPGWATARIRPCPGGLTSASGTIPTPRGPIEIDWQNEDVFRLSITLPEGMTAKLELPSAQDSSGVVANGTPIAATRQGDRWIVTEPVNGSLTLVVQ